LAVFLLLFAVLPISLSGAVVFIGKAAHPLNAGPLENRIFDREATVIETISISTWEKIDVISVTIASRPSIRFLKIGIVPSHYSEGDEIRMRI